MLPSLTSQTLPRQELTLETIQEMFTVFNENFAQTTLDIFTRDLNNKNWVILIRDDEKNKVQGFSTLGIYETEYQGERITAVYSGDTIIRHAYWGTPELPKKWIHTVLEKTENMPQPVYWLLISSGYKTYRFLTVFYKEYYPCYNQPTPPEMQNLINFLASQRYGNDFYPNLGIVRFKNGATPLREGVAKVTDERLKDEHIAFYLEKNPHHHQGDELVCITHIHPDNFTLAGKRMAR